MKLLLYLILLTLGVGCVEGNGQSEREVSASSQPLSVRVSQVNGSSVSRSLNYVGVVEAQRSASLSFSVAGRVERLFFEEGQRIKVGDVVATLNAKELSELYSAAQAKLLQAQDAMLRLQKLYDSNTLAPIKYVEVQTALREAESMEAVAKKRLEDATLRSTIAGVVAQKSVNEGENVAPHQSVLSVVSIDNEVSVKISVGEDVISKIEVGMPLEVEVDQLGG
ncbi:MAG: efflux RND transporter periplasmic adaptor subunit, partial [Rikenellaceae bacterium]